MSDNMRAFIGIPLPDEQRASLSRLQRELAGAEADVKWVAPDLLHVTLKFLGEIDEAQRQAVEQALQGIGKEVPSFALGLSGVGAFPSLTAPRVVWVGLGEGQEAVAHLAERIERGVAPLVRRQEARAFSPHLTLGRVRSSRGRQALVARLREVSWQTPPPWQINSLTLFQSVLSSQGPRYTTLAEVPLGAQASPRATVHRPQ